MPKATAIVVSLALLAVAGVAGSIAFASARGRVVEAIYEERLRDLTGEYAALRGRYDDAIRRTAVTELLVEGGALSVRVRTASGVDRIIETPYDPTGEVYVDYSVLDGRVWIRRVFDQWTPPSSGTLIDPALASVEWDGRDMESVGKAVYRSLGEGRWVVSVSGDGSLGLARGGAAPTELEAAPELGDFEQTRDEIATEVERIRPGEVLARIFGG